jgi:electron transfer flavoprotein alpha/beta subunit
MKILVCFKAGPDFDQVVDADWENFGLSSDLCYVKKDFGCFDQIALETALRLADTLKESGGECCALTLGYLPPALCRTLFAVGFDQVFAPPTESGLCMEFCPAETAAALKKLIATEDGRVAGGWDLILMGRQAGYADTGMVPLLLAEQLGLPAISGAELLYPGSSGQDSLVVERNSGNGRERLVIRLPAVVIMGNSHVSALRAATLAAQMKAAGKKAKWFPEQFLRNPAARKTGEGPVLIREQARKNCVFLPGGTELAQSAGKLDAELRKWRDV